MDEDDWYVVLLGTVIFAALLMLMLLLGGCIKPQVYLSQGCCTFTTKVISPVNPPDLKALLDEAK